MFVSIPSRDCCLVFVSIPSHWSVVWCRHSFGESPWYAREIRFASMPGKPSCFTTGVGVSAGFSLPLRQNPPGTPGREKQGCGLRAVPDVCEWQPSPNNAQPRIARLVNRRRASLNAIPATTCTSSRVGKSLNAHCDRLISVMCVRVLLHKANHRSKYGFRIWSGFVSKELGIVFCVSHPSLDFSDEMECVIKDALLDILPRKTKRKTDASSPSGRYLFK